jgi:hypothetical protein
VDDFSDVIKTAEKNTEKLGLGINSLFIKGKKQSGIFVTAMAEVNNSLLDTSRKAQIASNNMSNFSDDLKKQADVIKTTTEKYTKLSAEMKKSGSRTKEQEEQLKGYQYEIDEAKNKTESLTVELGKEGEALKQAQNQVVAINNSLMDNVTAASASTIALGKFQGGLAAIKAHAAEAGLSHLKDTMAKVGTFAGFMEGVKKLTGGFKQIDDHAHTTSRIALSLGDTTEVGMGRMAKSFREANSSAIMLEKTAIELDYSSEELSTTMNKVRSGIRMDKEGRLSEEAIQGMTKEAAYFARIAGVELSDSVALMETRVKRYGMSAAEATADLRNMRSTIVQLTAGNKQNTLAMGDMVHIIEEASAASQSYIVDTRIMTQALRGAVNQAEHLGVAQKQAKDVAVGVGKILSNAPDFIKIPAGFDLVHQLIGKDSDSLLDSLDAGTRTQAVAIQKALKSGQLDYFVGAKALMDLIGSTDAGLEAQSKHLENTILQGPAAAEMIAQTYGIENRATAFMITNMMKEAVQTRNEINSTIDKEIAKEATQQGKTIEEVAKQSKYAKITMATALVKDTAMMNTAIEETMTANKQQVAKLMAEEKINQKEAEDKVKEAAKKSLATKGLSKDQIEEYTNSYTTGLEKARQLEKDIADGKVTSEEDLAKRKAEVFKASTLAQTALLQGYKKPVESIMKDIKSHEGKEFKFTSVMTKEGMVAKIDPNSFKNAGITGEVLGKKLGVAYEGANKDMLDNMVKNGATQTELDQAHQDALNKIQAAEEDAVATNQIEKEAKILQKKFAWLHSPVMDMVKGIFLMGASLAGVLLGTFRTNMLLGRVLAGTGGTNMLLGKLVAMGGGDKGGGDKGGTDGDTFDISDKDKKGKSKKSKKPKGPTKGPTKGPSLFRRTRTKIGSKLGGIATRGKRVLNKLKPSGMLKSAGKVATGIGSVATRGTELAAKGISTMGGIAGKVGTGIAGGAKMLGKGVKGMGIGAKFLKLAKFGKAIPLIGSVIAAGFAVEEAWSFYSKWKKDPNSIKPSDKLKMVAALASMVPGIGSIVAAADLATDVTGGYDALDDITKQKEAAAKTELAAVKPISTPDLTYTADANAGSVTGTPTAMPAPMPTSVTATPRRTFAPPTGGAASLVADVGIHSLTPDGALTLKVRGFEDLLSQINKNKKLA